MTIARRQLLAAAAAWPLACAPCGARSEVAAPVVAGAADTLRFVFSRPFDNPRTQWLIRVYTHLVEELGKRFVYIDVPPMRATAMVLAGEADGELGRTFDYLTLFPALVRVPEPNNAVRFAAYATRPGLRFEGWPAARARGLRCEYRHGISELREMLSRELAADAYSHVQTIAQGLQKLRLGRTDLYFDVEEAVADFLFFLSDAERRAGGLAALHQAGVVRSTTGHAYLRGAHAALAPALAAGLARLKRRGTVKRYLEESLAAYKRGLQGAGK
ncbi:hypothetical protein JOD97_005886 [Duganella sp. 1411]|uniref:hypothetical protein n=1 Tax=Duganella sp. 1411 TaxID=2806572 RepID=UPI001AE7BA5E|nr:hypothetical protein [Duganella sp. 1411]MBP1207800.1 hypothetical protein [Duganella sp. 1411]